MSVLQMRLPKNTMIFSFLQLEKPLCVKEAKTFRFKEKSLKNLILFTNQIRDEKIREVYLKGLLVTVILILILLQLRSSLTNIKNKIDQLSSIRFYRKKLFSNSGLRCSLILSFYECYDFIEDIETLEYLAREYLSYKFRPKKFHDVPKKSNFFSYPSWAVCVHMGVLQSCPMTSSRYFNLNDFDIEDLGYKDALKLFGIENESSSLNIKEELRALIFSSRSGFSNKVLDFNDPEQCYSKIEHEIFGSYLTRGSFQRKSGLTFDSFSHREELIKTLEPFNLVRYYRAIEVNNIAIQDELLELAKTIVTYS